MSPYVRFEVLLAVNMKYIFWDTAPCILAVFTDESGEFAASRYTAGLLYKPKG
jgi:hypothetical protein